MDQSQAGAVTTLRAGGYSTQSDDGNVVAPVVEAAIQEVQAAAHALPATK